MKLTNITKNTILAEDAVVAKSFLARMRGLLGKKVFKQNQALIITPCNSVHTFFMHFPIDILFVGKDNCVLAVIEALKPYRFSKIYPNAYFVIELPAGAIKATSTAVPDKIGF